MGMREGLRIFFRRWRAAAPGQQQEPFLALLLMLVALGILCAERLAPPAPLCALLCVCALLLGVFLVWRQRPSAWLALAVLFFALGGLRFLAADALPLADVSRLAGQEARVEGRLRAAPVLRTDAQGVRHVRYEVEAVSVQAAGGRRQSAAGGLYVYAVVPDGQEPPAARVGDMVAARGRLRVPHGYQNPGQLDMRRMLRAAGITATLAAGKQGVRVVPQEGYAFWRALTAVREHYRASMERVMPREDAAAVFALLFGGYEGVSEELVADFTTTGIVHLLSVSGSHISLFAAVLAALAALLRLPRALRAGLVIGGIAVYALLAGCVPPVIRSALMGGLTFTALALGREHSARRILLLTGLFMLLCWPLLLFHISFQLSFLATAGLILLAPSLAAWLKARGCGAFLAAGIAVTAAAHLATMPVIAYYFNMFSVSSFVANLLLVPLVDLLIVLALAAGMAAWLLPPLGKLAFGFAGLLLAFVAETARLLARLPGSQIYVPSPGGMAVLLWYLALGCAFLPASVRTAGLCLCRRHARAGTFALAAACVVWGGVRLFSPPQLAVTFLDVHQGDAAVLQIGGHTFMIDCGGTRNRAFDVGGRVDVPYLLHSGSRSLDAIFLSHVHEDHAAGAGGVLRRLPVSAVLTAGEGRAAYARSMGLSTADPLLDRLVTLHTGERYTIDGVTIEAIAVPEAEEAAGNEACAVLRVRYGDAAFLFTGDMEQAQEAALLAAQRDVRCTVLKVGHHGSATSTSASFLAGARPRYAVISVGADNTFGHPRPEVLARLRAAGVRTFRTDEDGAVTFRTDGRRLWAETYAAGKVSLTQ